ncbi:MAG: TonB-dependent receptor, partial [Acinetobacter sp.]
GSYVYRADSASSDLYFGADWILDVDATYNITDNLSFTLGADNVLNTYPDNSRIIDTLGESKYSQFSPYGFYGGYYYGRITYRF